MAKKGYAAITTSSRILLQRNQNHSVFFFIFVKQQLSLLGITVIPNANKCGLHLHTKLKNCKVYLNINIASHLNCNIILSVLRE